MLGNKAAHGGVIQTETSLYLIHEAYLVGRWLCETYGSSVPGGYPAYLPPRAPAEQVNSQEDLARQLAEAREELARVTAASEQTTARAEAPDPTKVEEFRHRGTRAAKSIALRDTQARRQIGIRDAFSGFQLNEAQSELVDRLGDFLDGRAESVFLLKGYAGTGKTFITKGLTEYFRAIGRNYVLAAPTGKASKVIAAKTLSPAYTIHKTIYSFDDIAEYRDDDEDGTETFKFYARLRVNALSADTVYIVDEASMIADIYQEAEFFRFGTGFLLTDFLKFVNLDHNDHSKKVIFIGDDAQLPPVGMNFSPALDADYLVNHHGTLSTSFELTEVVRQKAESGVIANAGPLRTAVREKVFNRLSIDFGYPDVEKVEHGDLMARYIESCGDQINGEAIVIAHSNSDVADYNERIREHFFPGHMELMPGDKVMAVSNSDVYGLFISNGDFGLIRSVLGKPEMRTITLKRKTSGSGRVEEIKVPLSFRDVAIGFRDLDGETHFFTAKVLEDLLYSKEPNLSSDQTKALYLDFRIRNKGLRPGSIEFKHMLRSDPYFNALRLKFGYAITCHKAQGSEWNHVFVKCKSQQSQLSANYFRWLYTAITRTADRLYLLDPPNLTPWGGIKVVANPGASMFAQEVNPDQSPTGAGRPASATPDPGVTADDADDAFGIPAAAGFLRSLLTEVRSRIAGKDVFIEDIIHNQYKEAYVFKRCGEAARIDLGYNSRSKVTSVTATQLTQLGADLVILLSPLKGLPLATGTAGACVEMTFDEPFLNEFHRRVRDLCGRSSIDIVSVAKQQWSLRYTFTKGQEVAVYDIWYNGRGQLNRCAPLVTACSPGALVHDIAAMLTEGMKS